VLDIQDNCPLVANAAQADSLGNGIGDACRTAPAVTAPLDPITNDEADKEPPAAERPMARPCGAAGAMILWGLPLSWLALSRRSRVSAQARR
jgi:hypothetical protein